MDTQHSNPLKEISAVDISSLPPDGGDLYNRLIFEASPYLLQHAANPVHWWPWGEEAFAEARRKDRPIFLSIGYSTCHWCHVMAHESFEDAQVAELLNQGFISIKVDREERPDVDAIYMLACQMFTGQGGWPLTVVLTPDKEPFFAATYIPKYSRGGMPGLVDLLPRLVELWREDRSRLASTGAQVSTAVKDLMQTANDSLPLRPHALNNALNSYKRSWDRRRGGFGPAPKFPAPHNLSLLLRIGDNGHPQATEMACQTLQAIRNGGVYDQVGFGLHRYSVDDQWLIPHFEKMLYDQALFTLAACEAFQATGDNQYARMAEQTLDYVLRDLRHPQGGFFCGEDADSEGHEGTFYLWTPAQVEQILGPDLGHFACEMFNIIPGGQFEGKSIPHFQKDFISLARDAELELDEWQTRLEDSRIKLFAARVKRPRPHLDDKVITAWNGLIIAALAKTGVTIGQSRFITSAEHAMDFLLSQLRTPQGRLLRRWRNGAAAIPGFLEDYAFVLWGLLELFQATTEPRWLQAAGDLAKDMEELFSDGAGGYFDSGQDAETVLARAKSIHDGAIPAGSSVVVMVLFWLGQITNEQSWQDRGEKLLRQLLPKAEASPMAFSQLLIALDRVLRTRLEIVVLADNNGFIPEEMEQVLRQAFLPGALILRQEQVPSEQNAGVPALQGKTPGTRASVHICQERACQAPITDVEELKKTLQEIRAARKATGS